MKQVLIGPGYHLHTPDAIDPAAADTEFILAPGKYDVTPRRVSWHNVIVRGADPDKVLLNYKGPDAEVAIWTLSNKSGSATLKDLHLQLQPKVYVTILEAGDVTLDGITHVNGGIFHGFGGNSCTIRKWTALGNVWKYRWCNFVHRLNTVRVDNSMLPGQIIEGGSYEAVIREMQVDDSEWIGVNLRGHTKQAWQTRAGGPPGQFYKQRIYKRCSVKGGWDFGNFKDDTDKDFPFGVIGLVQLTGCTLDSYETTDTGKNGIGKAWGIRMLEFIGTTVAGKAAPLVKTKP